MFFLFCSVEGEFHKQVQSYLKIFIIISLGVLKSFFFLGLLFNLSIICLMYAFDIPFKSVFFGIYCLISPFMFSIAPFSHEEYGCAKYTLVFKSLAIILCAANSVPLSVVIDLTGSSVFLSILTTVSASGSALFPVSSFSISMKQLFLSTSVRMTPFPFFPTIVSISQSPNVLPSASGGLSSMDIRSGIFVLPCPALRLVFFPPLLRLLCMLSL